MGKSAGQTLLENAYKLATPEDNVEFYKAFAAAYDREFADALGYHYPAAIAAAYRDAAKSTDIPIADIGCGTGLVASALNLQRENIDGMDISADMLNVSRKKGLYRTLYQLDVTLSLEAIANDYGAVLSAGTFTSGHLGPDPLVNLLDIARDNALFVIGVNKAFFQQAGFAPVLSDLGTRGLIHDLQVAEVPIYDETGHDHSTDTAFTLTYRKS